MHTSKALGKLIKEWGWNAAILEAHAIGYREGRKSRGKVVARGWVFPQDFGCNCAVVGVVCVDKRQIRVEVVAKEVKRGKKK